MAVIGCRWADPITAAAATAVSALSSPRSTAIPWLSNRSVTDSGRLSASELTTAAGVPVASCASMKACRVVIQSATRQRSSRGRSSTSRPRSIGAQSSPVKQAVCASRSPQM